MMPNRENIFEAGVVARCVVRCDDIRDSDQVGGKARSLAALSGEGFPVPAWFVVTPQAFAVTAAAVGRPDILPSDGVMPVVDVRLATHLAIEVTSLLREIAAPGALFAVRSSASDEDSEHHSFAGQLESFLFVPASEVVQRIVDVWHSGFSDRVRAYRQRHELGEPQSVPAVIVQRMIEAEVSGVAFSADPVSGDRGNAVVASLFGLGTALVSGECDADTHIVDSDNRILERNLAKKKRAHRAAPGTREGVTMRDIEADRVHGPALSDNRIVQVARLARRCERVFGCPQDIEWSFALGKLHLLQSRPITSLGEAPAADGAMTIWDNSNINESYPGVTTPLTFSFARHAYEGVYRQLLRIFQVPARVIDENAATVANMIGLIRGRIYYNLLNWYRLIGLLPGARLNRAFLNQMLGVTENLADDAVEKHARTSWWVKAGDAVRLTGMIGGIAMNYFTHAVKTRRYHRRVAAALERSRHVTDMRADQLVMVYRQLEGRLLTRWGAPLVNDFFAMIFYGLLKKLCAAWCGDDAGTLQNDLLCATGGMVSTEPAARVQQMAHLVRDADLTEVLCRAQADDILKAVAEHHEVQACLDAYLEKFGERGSNELKLECPSLHDDPLMLFRSIGQLARSDDGTRGADEPRAGALRGAAETEARTKLRHKPFRRVLFATVLANTRRFVRGRENLRIERTRVYGRVRTIFVELGKRFVALDALDDANDVFYLQVEEVLGFVEGTSTCTNLRKLAALRKEEFEVYSATSSPDDRFATRGVVYRGNSLQGRASANEKNAVQLTGTGCCPGKVSGTARVILDPANATLNKGDILVARQTDPSWIMLFPFASGLLVERGNLLSHSAIVAREMGIPAIVSIEGVTAWLKDGDYVELDGRTGVVTKPARVEGGVE